jgi:hypothetical protein
MVVREIRGGGGGRGVGRAGIWMDKVGRALRLYSRVDFVVRRTGKRVVEGGGRR